MLTQIQMKAIRIVNEIKTIYRLPLILCLLAGMFSCSQSSNVQQEHSHVTSNAVPDSLELDTVEKVNINNQTIEIYTAHNEDMTTTYEYWYKDSKQIHFVQYPNFEINYKWLVDVDADTDLEIVRAQGYEDGVNYGIYEKSRNSETLILSFNPALLDERYPNQVFWGYPWDMESLVVNKKKQILSSFQISGERDDNYTMAENQKRMPYVFFYGKTTQPEFDLVIRSSVGVYVSLMELITQSRQEHHNKYQIPEDRYVFDSVSLEVNNSTFTILSLEWLSERNNPSGSHFGVPI